MVGGRGRGAPSTDLRRTARRIGLQTAGLLIGVLLVVSTVAYVAVVRSQEQQLNQTLTDAVSAAATGRADRGGDGDGDDRRLRLRLEGGTFTAVLHDGKVVTSEQLPPGLPDVTVMEQVAAGGVTDRRRVDLATGPYEILTVRHDDVVVQAMVSLLDQHQERERIIGALALAGGAGLVLATLAAVVLARRAVAPMAQALESQRRFVADAGHELRTPLTLLSTRAQLLRRRVHSIPGSAVDDLSLRDIDGIVADTRALTDILEELLLAADTRTPLPQEPVDLNALVAAAVSAAQAAAETSRITLSFETGTSASLPAGAPTALKRAVTALIDNALSHADQRVQVTLEHRGSQIAIEVADDGPGIADATLPRLFDRFSSDRDPSADSVRHYGLGLALVNEIAVRHGGTVHAMNRRPPNRGAVLTLLLPR